MPCFRNGYGIRYKPGSGGGGGGGSFRANRPAGWTNSAPLDFSQTVVAPNSSPSQIGTTLWNQNGDFTADWSNPSDATAPVSPPSTWKGTFKAGSYGEGLLIPSSGPFTATIAHPSNYGSTELIWDNGISFQFTKVASNPGLNQYSVNSGGTYTFNSGNAGQNVWVSYFFANNTGIPVGSVATGSGPGSSIGDIYTGAANGTSRIYFSALMYFDLPSNSYWHSISSKFMEFQCPGGDFVIHLFASGGNYLFCECADGSAFNLDSTHGQISNNPIPLRQWIEIESLIDLPNKTWKLWLNGNLTSANTNIPFVATSFNEHHIVLFRGGGGETLSNDVSYIFDDAIAVW